VRATIDAEAQFTPITAVSDFKIELGFASEQGEVTFFDLNNAAIGAARHFLAIGAVTNDDPARMRLGFERNIATMTAAVNGNGL
jgi:hypothetical protein